MFQYRGGGLPGDSRWNDDPEAANPRRGRHANQPARRIQKRASRKAIVHRRARADHLVNGPAASGRERSADHRHHAGRGGDGVAPRSRHGDTQVADTRSRRRRRQHRRATIPGTRSTARLVAGSQPASSASSASPSSRRTRRSVLATEGSNRGQDDIVGVDEAGAGTPSAMHLDDGRRGRGDRVGQLVGKDFERECSRHAVIVVARHAAGTSPIRERTREPRSPEPRTPELQNPRTSELQNFRTSEPVLQPLRSGPPIPDPERRARRRGESGLLTKSSTW